MADKKRADEAFNLLSNRLVSNLLSDQTYAGHVAAFVISEPGSSFPARFSRLWRKERFKRVFNASATVLEEFSTKPLIPTRLHADRMAALYLAILSAESTRLRAFYKHRHEYERALLRGEYEEAEAALRTCKSVCGESLWWVRSTITLLAQRGKLEEMERFTAECRSRVSRTLTSTLLNWFLLIASDPLLHLQKSVGDTIRELITGEVPSWAGLLTLIFMPRPATSSIDLPRCFGIIQVYPLVDQVWLLEQFVASSVATHGPDGDPYGFLDALGSIPHGPFSSNQASAELMTALTSLYEQGRYDELSASVQRHFAAFSSIFATANLVGKAAAIGGKHLIPYQNAPFGKIVAGLSQLYEMDAAPAKVEEDFLGRVITFHNFSDSAHLQLALYKALPHRFPPDDRRWAARLALAFGGGSPLSAAFAANSSPLLSHQYLSAPEHLPEDRRVKAQIRSGVSTLQAGVDLQDLLLQYQKSTPLLKDFLEVTAAQYLAAGAHDELVAFAASNLARNPNTYAALPMEDIVSRLEEQRPASLDSVIILYFHVRRVDPKKDDLLNETYEQYLLDCGVEKPSQLLPTSDLADPRVAVFFRDVCSLETMDYLSCFESSNELRAERIRLVDSLRDAAVILPDDHRSEVDEIIGQVIVDAGAAEFNLHKIEVNVASLKKRLQVDVAALLALYRSASVQQEDAVIRVDTEHEGDEAEKLRALVAGDKNTILLRLLFVVRDAYLYDEKFGLDKNLSTEIRHGFFSNLMRSRLEEAHLLTEADEHGRFQSNKYWLDANSILNDDILQGVDHALCQFSADFNSALSEAEEWMKVAVDLPSTPRVFNYDLYLSQLEVYKSRAQTNDADSFLDFCLGVLQHSTNRHLNEMRERLNVDFKEKVDALFVALLERVGEAKQNAPMSALMTAIVQVKNEIREDITTVSEWFKQSSTRVAAPRSIDKIIDISIECFSRIRGVRPELRIQISEGMQDVVMGSYHVKAFIVVIVNLLENAYRSSGFGAQTKLELIAIRPNHGWSLIVRNGLSESRRSSCTLQFVSDLMARVKSPTSVKLLRTEGGTGLSKVYHQLKFIDPKFDLAVSVLDGVFEVAITYADKQVAVG